MARGRGDRSSHRAQRLNGRRGSPESLPRMIEAHARDPAPTSRSAQPVPRSKGLGDASVSLHACCRTERSRVRSARLVIGPGCALGAGQRGQQQAFRCRKARGAFSQQMRGRVDPFEARPEAEQIEVAPRNLAFVRVDLDRASCAAPVPALVPPSAAARLKRHRSSHETASWMVLAPRRRGSGIVLQRRQARRANRCRHSPEAVVFAVDHCIDQRRETDSGRIHGSGARRNRSVRCQSACRRSSDMPPTIASANRVVFGHVGVAGQTQRAGNERDRDAAADAAAREFSDFATIRSRWAVHRTSPAHTSASTRWWQLKVPRLRRNVYRC